MVLDPACLSNTSGSDDWLEKNLGGFSDYAPLEELKLLNANFSSVSNIPAAPSVYFLWVCNWLYSGRKGWSLDFSGENRQLPFVFLVDLVWTECVTYVSCPAGRSVRLTVQWTEGTVHLAAGFRSVGKWLCVSRGVYQCAHILRCESTWQLLRSLQPDCNTSEDLCSL